MNPESKQGIHISEKEVDVAAKKIAEDMEANWTPDSCILTFSNSGIHACSAILKHVKKKVSIFSIPPEDLDSCFSDLLHLFENREVFVVDDIIDTGTTIKRFADPFGLCYCDKAYFLVDKQGPHREYTPTPMLAGITEVTGDYIFFPWEE